MGAMVKHYQDDPLALDSEDEKNLGRVEKEARKDTEHQASKHWCGKQVTASKRPRWGQGFKAIVSELLATTYPLSQLVVSSAEVSTLDKVELSLYVGGVNSVAAEPVTSNNCDVKLKASDQSVWCEGTNEQSAFSGNSNFLTHDELDTSDNLTKFWEAEGSTPV